MQKSLYILKKTGNNSRGVDEKDHTVSRLANKHRKRGKRAIRKLLANYR
jgi:hypothetical protein